jgi:hypothetical protein
MMKSNQKPLRVHEIQNAANEALDAARNLAPGTERIEALKKAGLLRNAADQNGLIFAKRGRPAK